MKKKRNTFFHNLLINEESQYLKQHANNPVDWVPWHDRFLQEAQEKNKLVIISIGYSSCHWCHVMEKEVFRDLHVAKVMNRFFINIKVDREERPDIDKYYMNFALKTNASAGWPLNIIALPDGTPVYACSYRPKKEWINILKSFQKIWEESPEKIQRYAQQLHEEKEKRNNNESKESFFIHP
jgi:hypothetical protein